MPETAFNNRNRTTLIITEISQNANSNTPEQKLFQKLSSGFCLHGTLFVPIWLGFSDTYLFISLGIGRFLPY
jgi:hypothetical protein